MHSKKIIIIPLICSFMSFGLISKVSQDKSNISPVYAADEYTTLWEGRSDNVTITSDKLPSTNPKSFRIVFLFDGGDDVNICTLNDYVVFNVPVFEKQFEINFPANDWARILDDGGLKFSTGTFSGNEFEKISCTKDSPAIGETFIDNEINYIVTSVGDVNTVSVGTNTSFSGTTLTIPSTVMYFNKEFTVNGIGSSAFYNIKTLEEVEFPNTITFIKDRAFGYCNNLSNLVLPESLEVIEHDAFEACNLTSLIIPSNVVSIGENAFGMNYNLSTVTIKATTPPSFGDFIFLSCNKLDKICVPVSSVDAYKAAWSEYKSKIMQIPWEIGAEGNETNVKAWLTEISSNPKKYKLTIEGTGAITDYETHTSMPWASYKDLIASVEISEGITNISKNLLRGCSNLTSVTLPESIESIGEGAFCHCPNLSNITIPDNVTSIGEVAFEYCYSLEEITIPSNVTTIGEEAFDCCEKLATVICNPSIPPTLGDCAFDYCASTFKICVPASSVDAYRTAWTDYADKIEALPEPGPKVGDTFTFNGLNYEVTSVGDTNTVKVGDNRSFEGNSVTIPETVMYLDEEFNVVEIGYAAFMSNSSIVEVNVSKSVTVVGKNSFENCGNLEKITFAEGSKLTLIQDSAFFDNNKLTEIKIPAGVTEIGYNAFYQCASLSSVTFEKGSKLTTIGTFAFGRTNISMIDLASTLTSIGYSAFAGCLNLETIKIRASEVPTLGGDAFESCYKLTNIFVPEDSVNAYKTADNWYMYSSKIAALSHEHAIKEIHDEVDSSCVEAGHKAYYECECGAFFSDEGLTKEISDLQAWLAEDGEGYIAPKGHSTSKVLGVAPTDTSDGYKDAYKCNVCGKYFEDADGTKLIGDEAAYNAWKLGEGKIPALNPQGNKGLSGGAIVGIAVGSLVGVCLIAYIIMFFVWKKNEKAPKFLKPSFVWINKKIFRK